MFLIVSLLLLASCVYSKPVNDDFLGRTCGPTENGTAPRIMYFWDSDREEAYPFLYRGCGGGDPRHRFEKLEDVRGSILGDSGYCPGYYQGQRCSKGGLDTMRNGDIIVEKKDCPSGEYCLHYLSPVHGFCCSQKTTERFELSRNPKCKAGQKVQTYPSGRVFFGLTCKHDFCQQGAECIEGEFDAHCCVPEN